jgi:hypothetical protein
MKRSVFLSLNVFWALVAMGVAINAPERVAIYLQSRFIKPPPVATDTEVQSGLATSGIPKELATVIASLHRGDPQRGTDGKMHKPDSITGVPMRDGLQIYDIVRRVKPKKTLEIGLAYGVVRCTFWQA